MTYLRLTILPLLLTAPLLAAPGTPLDDFEAPALEGWSHKENATLERVPVDGGHALRMTADFSDVSYAWAYRSLGGPVDLTDTGGVQVRYRGDGAAAALRLVVQWGAAQAQTNPPLTPGPEWRSLFIPWSQFGDIDPANLVDARQLGVALFQAGEAPRAEVWIDDLALVPNAAMAPAPELLAPDDGWGGGEAPRLAWRPVPGATRYRVVLTPVDGGDAVTLDTEAADASPTELPEGTYTWTVEALGADFVVSTPSASRRLTVDTTPPRLTAVAARPEAVRLTFDDVLGEAPTVTLDGAPLAGEVTLDGATAVVAPAQPLAAGPHRLSAAGAVNRVGLRQAAAAEETFTVPEWLPFVEDRSEQVTKASVTAADLDWFGREALGAGNELSNALLITPTIINAVDAVTGSPTYGWQASHRYRSRPDAVSDWDIPSNARIMEAIYTPLLAYTLDRPFNPYYHDPALRERLELALGYWLDLQGEDGGFPEYAGLGSQELPSTSFGMEFLVEIDQMLADDEAFDPELKQRLRTALERAAVWASTPGKRSTEQGYHYSNQYGGALYGMWRLYEITGDERWREMYDERLDAWIENAQQLPFWYEADAPETFGYSRITEWELDRILIHNDDPRIIDTLRGYYEWAALNTVVERDERTFIMDNVAHGRTSSNGPGDSVGYANHIATILPEARPWTTTYVMTAEQREERAAAWLAAPVPDDRGFPPGRHVYNPFSSWMYFQPHGLWTITEAQRLEAVRALPTVAQERFTKHFHSDWGNDDYLFARRPGAYLTLHWGQPGSKQGKELGLVWIPGFGTLLRSYNDQSERAARTDVGERSTYHRPIFDPTITQNGEPADLANLNDAAPIAVTTTYDDLGVTKTWAVDDDGFTLSVEGPQGAVERLPVYLDRDDAVSVDGQAVDLTGGSFSGNAQRLAITRSLGGEPATATLALSGPGAVELRRVYNVARGGVWMLSVPVDGELEVTVGR